MKKSLIFSIFSATVLFCSCGTEEPTQIPDPPSTPSVDAAATTAHYEYLIGQGESQYSAAGQAGVAGALASLNYIVFRHSGTVPSTITAQDLPSAYLLEGNPFEDAGIMHNRLVNYYISVGGPDSAINKFLNYDSLFYDAALQTSALSELNSSLNRPLIYSDIVEDSIAHIAYAQVSNISGVETQDDLYDLLPTFSSSARRDTLISISNQYNDLKSQEATTKEVVDFLNIKITSILEESEILTLDMQKQLIYLTIMKHSFYLWRNVGL